MNEMLTYEQHGEWSVVTVLDDSGRDADLEIHMKDLHPTITLRQAHPDTMDGDVIVLTALQAHCLLEVLMNCLEDDDTDITLQ